MNNDQLTQKEVIGTQDIDPLAIFFFFMGALHIYSSLRRKARERQEQDRESLSITRGISLVSYGKVALLALVAAGMIEIYLF